MLASQSEIEDVLKCIFEKQNQDSSQDLFQTTKLDPIKLINLNRHKEALKRYSDLSQLLSQLNQLSQMSNDELKEKAQIESELKAIEEKHLSPSHLKLIEVKIEKIRRKRRLRKQSSIKRKYFFGEMMKKRQEIELNIEQNAKKEEEKIAIENERECDLNQAMNGIKLKIKETKLILEKLRLLEKLRGYLKAKSCDNLESSLNECSQREDSSLIKLEEIKELTNQHLQFYKNEAQKFQNLIIQNRGDNNKLQTSDKQQIVEAFFGDQVNYSEHFIKRFLNFRSSLSELIEIRKKWDQYISEEGSPVPTDWVIPPSNPNQDWRRYLS